MPQYVFKDLISSGTGKQKLCEALAIGKTKKKVAR
jgi:hypothetical protein